MTQTEFRKVKKLIEGPLRAISINLQTLSDRCKAKQDLDGVRIIEGNLVFLDNVYDNIASIEKNMVKEKKPRATKVTVKQ